MSFRTSQVLDFPISQVFEWHLRKGALQRLSPPWTPFKVAHEADSIVDGTASFALPLGLEWRAQHIESEFEDNSQFSDRLVSQPLASLLRWTHKHRFISYSDSTTKLLDEITTTVPGRFLKRTFEYRHRQLADDLASHQKLRMFVNDDSKPLVVGITGASGLIGSQLCAFLLGGGYKVIRFTRSRPNSADERFWDVGDPDPTLLGGIDILIHLAGKSIAGRFTQEHMHSIYSSRYEPTRKLARLIADARASRQNDFRLKCLVSASAIGFYGTDRGDELLVESADKGDGFLAGVVSDWEKATEIARDSGVRCVNLRTGVVLTPRGGALRRMLPIFRLGLGGPIGAKKSWISSIGIDDALDVIVRCALDNAIEGPVNMVSPQAVTNLEFASTLGKVLRRPARLPVPMAGPQIILGKLGAQELLGASQRAVPKKLNDLGFTFRHPALENTLRHNLGRWIDT